LLSQTAVTGGLDIYFSLDAIYQKSAIFEWGEPCILRAKREYFPVAVLQKMLDSASKIITTNYIYKAF
jgi:hypothetical protein